MKRVYCLILLFTSMVSFAQTRQIMLVDFEDTATINSVWLDSVLFPSNIWEIGSPDINSFDSAYSKPNVIITGKNKSYPINNTSTFVITHIFEPVKSEIDPTFMGLIFHGEYAVDTDSLNDFGTIEFSDDLGETWYNVADYDTLPGGKAITWDSPKPILTGNSNGWQSIHFRIHYPFELFKYKEGDTIQYRFSFFSDNMKEDKPGLMFDHFFLITDYWRSTSVKELEFESRVYPNPSDGQIKFEIESAVGEEFTLEIFDSYGRQIIATRAKESTLYADLSKYLPGIYHYRLLNEHSGEWSVGKIVKQ